MLCAAYRIGLGPRFRFEQMRELLGYLHAIGVTDLHVRGLFPLASAGSSGTEIADLSRLNPDLGEEHELETLVDELRAKGMRLVAELDPGHTAATPENPWWAHCLEHGPASPYAPLFDADWEDPRHDGRLLLPVLAAPYGRVLERGELVIELDDGGLTLHYGDMRLPLDPKSYRMVLTLRSGVLEGILGAGHPDLRELRRLVSDIDGLPQRTDRDPEAVRRRLGEADRIKERLRALAHPSRGAGMSAGLIGSFLHENLRILNGVPADPHSFNALEDLLGAQAYRLAFRGTSRTDASYRHPPGAPHLVRMRLEDPRAFDITQRKIVQLARAGHLAGLRIAGFELLDDPPGYVQRLREAAGRELAVFVDPPSEAEGGVPERCGASGDTGGSFAAALGGVFLDPAGLRARERLAAGLEGGVPAPDARREGRRRALEEIWDAETSAVCRELEALARRDRHGRDLAMNDLRRALVETTVHLPVARTFIRGPEVSFADRQAIEAALAEARQRLPSWSQPALGFLQRVLRGEAPAAPVEREAWIVWTRRWQRLAASSGGWARDAVASRGPAGEAGNGRGGPVRAFHEENRRRLAAPFPPLSASVSPESRLPEGVGARLAVLSELPGLWESQVTRWMRVNRRHKRPVGGRLAPTESDEVGIYELLVGVWPLRGSPGRELMSLVRDEALRAARNAERDTGRLFPDHAYERALAGFLRSTLEPSRGTFRRELTRIAELTATHGAVNALGGALAKVAAPGLPVIEADSETWTMSLGRDVRQTGGRGSVMEELAGDEADAGAAFAEELLDDWRDGRIKQYVLLKALRARRERPEVFRSGAYVPLWAQGRRSEHVCAFARASGGHWVLVVVPRLTVRLCEGAFPLGPGAWGRTTLGLPPGAPSRWRSLLTGDLISGTPRSRGRSLLLSHVFGRLPVALLVGERASR